MEVRTKLTAVARGRSESPAWEEVLAMCPLVTSALEALTRASASAALSLEDSLFAAGWCIIASGAAHDAELPAVVKATAHAVGVVAKSIPFLSAEDMPAHHPALVSASIHKLHTFAFDRVSTVQDLELAACEYAATLRASRSYFHESAWEELEACGMDLVAVLGRACSKRLSATVEAGASSTDDSPGQLSAASAMCTGLAAACALAVSTEHHAPKLWRWFGAEGRLELATQAFPQWLMARATLTDEAPTELLPRGFAYRSEALVVELLSPGMLEALGVALRHPFSAPTAADALEEMVQLCLVHSAPQLATVAVSVARSDVELLISGSAEASLLGGGFRSAADLARLGAVLKCLAHSLRYMTLDAENRARGGTLDEPSAEFEELAATDAEFLDATEALMLRVPVACRQWAESLDDDDAKRDAKKHFPVITKACSKVVGAVLCRRCLSLPDQDEVCRAMNKYLTSTCHSLASPVAVSHIALASLCCSARRVAPSSAEPDDVLARSLSIMSAAVTSLLSKGCSDTARKVALDHLHRSATAAALCMTLEAMSDERHNLSAVRATSKGETLIKALGGALDVAHRACGALPGDMDEVGGEAMGACLLALTSACRVSTDSVVSVATEIGAVVARFVGEATVACRALLNDLGEVDPSRPDGTGSAQSAQGQGRENDDDDDDDEEEDRDLSVGILAWSTECLAAAIGLTDSDASALTILPDPAVRRVCNGVDASALLAVSRAVRDAARGPTGMLLGEEQSDALTAATRASMVADRIQRTASHAL
jgi:hypothetical protein